MHDRCDIWTTREGKTLELQEMSSDHLENVLNHIKRNAPWIFEDRPEFIFNLKQEIRLRKLNRIGSEDDISLF